MSNLNQILCRKLASNTQDSLNWIWMPGGPGVESDYFVPLIEEVELPGTLWLVDFPGNGRHLTGTAADQDFDAWFDLFLPFLRQFEHPVFVGHSFSGMFPLLFPELESILSGLVILNAAPTLWFDAAADYARQKGLPEIAPVVDQFLEAPSEKTFHAFLDAALPYFFPQEHLDKGRAFLAHTYWRYEAAVWWQKKALEISFSAQWIPEHVPTLIICGSEDGITPSILFQNDGRFQRDTIDLSLVKNAGHFCWIDQPQAVARKLQTFAKTLAS